MHLADKNLAYIADGGNVFRTDIEIHMDIKNHLRIRLVSCVFDQQNRADYCVSSAIVIGIQMLKSYHAGFPPLKITSPKTWYKRICSALHKYNSLVIQQSKLSRGRPIHTCRACGKSFQQSKACKMHERRCKS